MELLTTREVAAYLRIGERKIYDLVAAAGIPCTRVAGKWLFPRHEVDRWLLSGMTWPPGMRATPPPRIIGGSQDDLLEWAMRASHSGLASLVEGTAAGVARVVAGGALAAGIHFHAPDVEEEGEGANITAVRRLPGFHDAVVVAFARREQGMLLAPGNPLALHDLAGVRERGARLALRQKGAGARQLLDMLLVQAGMALAELNTLEPPLMSGPDLAAAIHAGAADCGIATRGAANAHGLEFVPLLWEKFDLVMHQGAYFGAPMQRLLRFLGTDEFHRRAVALGGYDTGDAGVIRLAKGADTGGAP